MNLWDELASRLHVRRELAKEWAYQASYSYAGLDPWVRHFVLTEIEAIYTERSRQCALHADTN